MLEFLNRNLVLMVAAATMIGFAIAVLALMIFESTMGWQLAFALLLLGMIGLPIILSFSRGMRRQ